MEMTNEIVQLLNGAGSGVILLIALYYFIRYIAEQERLNSEERMATHQKFCETIVKLTRSVVDGGDDDD